MEQQRMTEAMDGRPILVGADLHARIREVAFALILIEQRPLAPDEIGHLVGMTGSAISPFLDELQAIGWIDRDDAGRVTGSGGLSLSHGPHELRIGGATFHNWCAYDSLGIAAALATDATIRTACAVCGSDIVVVTADGRPPGGRPERLWLADGGGDLRSDFCALTVLLCAEAHARAWARQQGGRGRIVDLTEAAELGAAGWAGCATTVATLRGMAS
jgi:hypothetical protein